MDKYTELKQTIEAKYKGGEVEHTENIISLYDLFNIITEEMMPLNKIKVNNELQDKINADRTFLQKIGMFRKQAIIDKKCTCVRCGIGEKRSEVAFSFEDKGRGLGTHILLYKDLDSDELYFSDFCEQDRDFVTKYISEIYDMFAVLENYGSLFPYKKDKGRCALTQNFDDGVLSITITCDTYGRVSALIVPSEGVDSGNLYTRQWYNRKSISEYVNEMKEDILRSIPVEISNLNEVFRKLVEDNLAKKNGMKYDKNFGTTN